MTSVYWHRAFGLTWRADIPLALFHPVTPPVGPPDVVVLHARQPPPRGEGTAFNKGIIYPDGVRLKGEEIAQLDMVDGCRILYTPGPDWRDDLPGTFYGTATALLLAWRGGLPLHASAVAVDRRVLLVVGESGAGKSTLVAGLCRAGAALVGDDLSVMVRDDDGRPCVPSGRAAIRLYPEVAARVGLPEEGRPDARGKRLVRPPVTTDGPAMPVAAVVLLEDGAAGRVPHPEAMSLLRRNLFRPRWLSCLPGEAARRLDLLALSRMVPCFRLPPVDARRQGAFDQAAQSALVLIKEPAGGGRGVRFGAEASGPDARRPPDLGGAE